jgi:Lipopolysaccharide export system permease LptF/LptG
VRRSGDRLRAFATRWCSPEAMSRLIDPVIADLQVESAKALGEGRNWRARWARLSGYVAFMKVFVICDWSPRDDMRPLLRTAGIALAATVVVTAVFDWIPMTRSWSAPADRRTVIVSLIPQALTMSIPIGLTIGIALGVARQRVSARLAAALAAATAVISIGSVANVGWVLPNANQTFRAAMWEGVARLRGQQNLLPVKLERGEPELTFGELAERIHKYGASPPGSWEWWRANSLRLHYHTRWSLAFASLALALFSASLAASTRRRWVVGVGVVAVIVGYYIIQYSGRALTLRGDLSPPVAAWLANVVTLMVSALLVVRARLRSRAEQIADGHAFHA